jgi:hypothetical protein
MTRTTFRPAHALLALAVAFGAGAAHAANYSKAVLDGARDDVKREYKANKDRCDKMDGNAKDICVQEAKGLENVALAWLDYNYSGTPADQKKLNETIAEARHEVAKEKCDDRSGDAKDLCQREAKTAYDKAMAEAKLNKKVADAMDDAERARMKADYKLASERCASLNGDSKDICVASAKARYHERW